MKSTGRLVSLQKYQLHKTLAMLSELKLTAQPAAVRVCEGQHYQG
jgi:hypothetical protein